MPHVRPWMMGLVPFSSAHSNTILQSNAPTRLDGQPGQEVASRLRWILLPWISSIIFMALPAFHHCEGPLDPGLVLGGVDVLRAHTPIGDVERFLGQVPDQAVGERPTTEPNDAA